MSTVAVKINWSRELGNTDTGVRGAEEWARRRGFGWARRVRSEGIGAGSHKRSELRDHDHQEAERDGRIRAVSSSAGSANTGTRQRPARDQSSAVSSKENLCAGRLARTGKNGWVPSQGRARGTREQRRTRADGKDMS